MKKYCTLIAVFAFSLSAHAQLFSKPSLYAVKGHIETNDPTVDLSQVKVAQGLHCTKGWGDGMRSCGHKVVEAKVDAKGNFDLPGVKGEREGNWSSTSYTVFYADKVLFANPFVLREDKDKDTIKKLLSSFTIYTFSSFHVKFTTDTGMSFEEWMKNWNRNIPVGIWFAVNTTTTPNDIGRILPDQRYIERFENKAIDVKPQMIPGTLQNALANSTIFYQVQSRHLGNYAAKMISDKKIKLTDEALYEKLANVELQTQLINYKVDGIWNVGVHISFHEGNHYFQYEDPGIFIESKCEDGILKGKLRLEYRKLTRMNEVRDLSGTCALGKAEFDVKVTATNFDQENDLRNFDLKVRIFNIAADSSEAEVVDMATGKVYMSYGGADRCKSISQGNYGAVCDR